jgi:hypothetical protein
MTCCFAYQVLIKQNYCPEKFPPYCFEVLQIIAGLFDSVVLGSIGSLLNGGNYLNRLLLFLQQRHAIYHCQ